MQSTSWEMLGWKKHKLESRLPREMSITSDIQRHHPYGRKWRRTKEPIDESERGEWKNWHKTQPSKNKDHGMQSITSWQIDGETMQTVTDFIFLGSTITENGDCSREIKRCLLAPWKKSYDQHRKHITKQRHYFANKGPSSQSYGFSSSPV